MLSKPMLTLHEVSDLLKVKESTVRSWIRDKTLRAVKFGREWRVAHKDLEAFLEAHANRPAEPSTDHPHFGDGKAQGEKSNGTRPINGKSN